MAEGAGYVAFGSGRRSMRGAFATAKSADKDTIPKIESLRASSRDMFMNSPVATAALKRARTNIVGIGLALQCRINREFLGLTDEAAEEWEQKTEREFELWASSKDCDITRVQNFYDLQSLALLSTLMSGDCFVALPYKPRPNMPYDLRIRLIEADQVSNPFMQMDTDKIAGGVEVDSDGAPVKYYISKQHPGGFSIVYEWVPVDVYSGITGRRQVYHLFDRERPGQRRGIPMLSPVIESLKQITRLSESELMASVVSSFFTAFIKSNAGSGDVLADGFASTEKISDADARADDANVYEMGHGSIVGLNDGEDVVLADPKRPSALFEPFFNAVVRQIGASVEMPAELIMLHFTASYSASRAALLEAWKFISMKRSWLEYEFCRPIYEEWLYEAILKKRIDAPGYISDPAAQAAWSGSAWTGQGQGQLDPVRETQAAILRVKNNLSTYTAETAAIAGDDWQTMIHSRSREEKILNEKGLNAPAATATPTPQNTAEPAPPADDTNSKTRDQEDAE